MARRYASKRASRSSKWGAEKLVLALRPPDRSPEDQPAGLKATGYPTAGKRSMPTMRFYGPTEAFNNRTFKLPGFELVGENLGGRALQ
jgi:hypothetical protein